MGGWLLPGMRPVGVDALPAQSWCWLALMPTMKTGWTWCV